MFNGLTTIDDYEYHIKHMEFLTRREVAKYLRVHERTVDRWIESGLLKSYKLGEGKTALLRIPKSEVEKFLEKNKS